MSVRIPVSADPSQTVAAFDQIRAAMRRAGQEGRALADIDFSHPELREMADDIRAAQRNFAELQKVGRGATAVAVRAGNYRDVLDWAARHGRQFPEADARGRHTNTVGRYVFQGTGFEPPAPPPPGGKGGGFGGLPIGGIKSVIGGGLALAGIGGLMSTLTGGAREAADEAYQLDIFGRMLGDTTTAFDELRENARRSSDGLQLTYQESVKLSQAYARASALVDAGSVEAGKRLATEFSRSFGVGPEAGVGFFGQAQYLGMTGDNRSQRQLAVLISDAIASGGMFAKADEVMAAITDWVQQSERVMVGAPNLEAYADLTARMNNSKQPGLRGAAGAALIAKIDAAIRGGGSFGEAGRNFLFRALNADSQGGVLSPYQVQYLLEEGAMGTRASAFGGQRFAGTGLGIGDKTTMQLAMEEITRRFGMQDHGLVRAEALKNLFGISMHQADALFNLGGGGVGALQKMLGDYDIDLKDLNVTGIKELSQIALAKGDSAKLGALRSQFLSREDLTQGERQAISGADTDDALRRALAEAAARVGRMETEGSRTQQAIVDVKKAIMDVGDELLTPINAIRNYVAKLAGGTDSLVNDVADAATGDGEAAKRLAGFGSEMAMKSMLKMTGLSLLGVTPDDIPTVEDLLPQQIRMAPNPQMSALGLMGGGTLSVAIQPIDVVHKNERGDEMYRQKHEATVTQPVPHGG